MDRFKGGRSQRASVRRKLQAAYEQPTAEAATRALGRLRQELRLMNESAVTSLDEGLDETLTLHRLGLFPQLGVSLKTTNCLESLNALLGQRTDKVDRWRTSDQKQRWLAAASWTSSRDCAGSKGSGRCRCCGRRSTPN